MTGSCNEKEKNLKMSLLSVYQRDIVPNIQDKYAYISEGGCFKLVSLNQEDRAEPTGKYCI